MCRYALPAWAQTRSGANRPLPIGRRLSPIVCDEREVVVKDALVSLGIFVLVLVVLKFFFGWNISIIGSVVLTIILSLIFRLLNRR